MSSARGLTAVAAALLLSGCLGGSVPAPELYRLAPIIRGDTAAVPRGMLDGSVAIDRYATPGIYGDRGIVYRVDETRYGVYPYREWAVPLGEMLGLQTEDVLAESPLSAERAVFEPASRRGVTYVWRGAVRQFEEADRGKQVFAVVEIEAKLVRASDDSVLWGGSSRLEREVTTPTMPAIVTALSELSQTALKALATEAKSAVERGSTRDRATKP